MATVAQEHHCAYAADCQACGWVNRPYHDQIATKEAYIRSLFPEDRLTIHRAERPVSYRRQSLVRCRVSGEGHVRVGFHSPASQDFVSVGNCILLTERLQEVIANLSSLQLKRSARPYRLMLQEFFHETSVTIIPPQPSEECEELAHHLREFCDHVFLRGQPDTQPLLHSDTFRGIELYQAVGEFRQVHQEQNGRLQDLLFMDVQERQPHGLLDMFCGNGNLSIGPAKILGIPSMGCDTVGRSIDAAQQNAEQKGGCNATYRACTPEELIATESFQADYMIVDPPRKGLGTALAAVMTTAPTRLAYVSCNLDSLKVDLQTLASTYHIDSVHMIDMFPCTPHTETLVFLDRKLSV